jgi:signal transduction histidine kinase
MRENKARGKAVQRIKDYQSELNNRIVELARANTELLQMRRLEKFVATGRIARTIAHEVRNPLTNINLAADQLKTEWTNGNGEANMLFEMIGRNSNRINQLISDLLNSTKFSELNYVKHSINTILDETLELAKDRISLDNIQIVKKYSKDICDVTIDKERIKIAFLNIIVNAIEAMKDKDGQGVLTIKTKAEKGKCKVIISDNGPGMDEDTMAKLFEPYFTTKVKGNGLGLANTQNIILNHKGDINVLSSRGRGSMFTIILDFAK